MLILKDVFCNFEGYFMPFWPILSIPNYFWMLLIALTPCTIYLKNQNIQLFCHKMSKKMELKWTKLFKTDNFKRLFILLWRLFRGFLKIGWQNYFKIMFFLLTNTYILICMWRNVRYNFLDLRLGSGYMWMILNYILYCKIHI